MIEKETAINILEDIERCLYDDEWKHKTLSSVEQYIKGLEIAVDKELKELIDKYKKCEDNSDEAMLLADKINEKILSVYHR